MRNIWILTKDRMRLALRNKTFIFFSVLMPLLFLFLYCGLFARVFTNGAPWGVRMMLGPVLAITVMGSFWGLSIQLVTYREMGVLRRYRLAPINAGQVLASSILSNYFLTLPTVVIEFVLARWIFHLDAWGDLRSIAIMVTVGSITFAALGLIVASVMATMQATQAVNNLIWSAFLFLSGATLPLNLLPNWLQRFAFYLPATYLVTSLQRALIGREAISHLVESVVALLTCAALAFIISQQLFRWEPETKTPPRAKLWAASTIIPFLFFGSWEWKYGTIRQNMRSDYQLMERMMPRQPQPPAKSPTP